MLSFLCSLASPSLLKISFSSLYQGAFSHKFSIERSKYEVFANFSWLSPWALSPQTSGRETSRACQRKQDHVEAPMGASCCHSRAWSLVGILLALGSNEWVGHSRHKPWRDYIQLPSVWLSPRSPLRFLHFQLLKPFLWVTSSCASSPREECPMENYYLAVTDGWYLNLDPLPPDFRSSHNQCLLESLWLGSWSPLLTILSSFYSL